MEKMKYVRKLESFKNSGLALSVLEEWKPTLMSFVKFYDPMNESVTLEHEHKLKEVSFSINTMNHPHPEIALKNSGRFELRCAKIGPA